MEKSNPDVIRSDLGISNMICPDLIQDIGSDQIRIRSVGHANTDFNSILAEEQFYEKMLPYVTAWQGK